MQSNCIKENLWIENRYMPYKKLNSSIRVIILKWSIKVICKRKFYLYKSKKHWFKFSAPKIPFTFMDLYVACTHIAVQIDKKLFWSLFDPFLIRLKALRLALLILELFENKTQYIFPTEQNAIRSPTSNYFPHVLRFNSLPEAFFTRYSYRIIVLEKYK